MDTYPTPYNISDSNCTRKLLPHLLQVFMGGLISNDLKQTCIGQCIFQAVRPKSVIAPVPFGIGVSLHHEFGCEQFIRCLSRMGLFISYDEVTRFEQSAVQCEHYSLPEACRDMFTQWAADNVDCNTCTLDGYNTTHAMGFMSMSVLSQPGDFDHCPITRLARTNASQLVKNRGVPIIHYSPPDISSLSICKFKPWLELQRPFIYPTSVVFDRLFDFSWFFSDADKPTGSWSAFMHDVSVDSFPPPAEFRLLPIIDMNPGDLTCIYSTLMFIEREANRLNMPTACVTFDQPLWLKAMDVIASKGLNIVCRLGGFNTIMSYLGSIAHVMKGSGLSEAFQCCYGSATVVHMLSGKVVARSLRAHFLVQSALIVILLKPILRDIGSVCTLESSQLHDLRSLFEKALSGSPFDMDDAVSNTGLQAIENFIVDRSFHLMEFSRTAKLWLNYVKHVSLLKKFIRAERTGDWNLHLTALSEMIPLFAATGHNNYAKSGRLYLQQMLDLPHSHPWLYGEFIGHGFHVVRRSNRYWAGISTDLAIEQVMMRALKSRGGLTRGRGMTGSVRLHWLRTLHVCASVHSALNKLTDLRPSDDDDVQHKEAGVSRKQLCRFVQVFVMV
jgi:hypothetical protein